MCIIQLLISVNGEVFWTMQIRSPYRCTGAMLPVLSGVRVSYLHLLICTCMYYFVLCCVCVFSMSGLCPWITFIWFSLESWFHWLLFQDKTYVPSNLLFGQYQSASILTPRAIPVCVHTCLFKKMNIAYQARWTVQAPWSL